ncbi:hypothetical protein PQU96_06395 [Vogesella sp. LYT5W]|uniref:MxaK protein n=1 Tax=Vogesella margarita TaxID=2984199 RepID=A0ABT5IMG6_9NEIS|nr:hypothetical protein [Vogesella margarita]MDC7713768.1 hypothetical protein [Vogesella margarita]
MAGRLLISAVAAASGGALLLFLAQPRLPVAESVFPPDRNGDLLRDDVGDMIAARFAGNAAAFAASSQLARAWQRAVRQTDPARLGPEVTQVRYAMSCVLGEQTLGKARVDAQTMLHFLDQLHARMFDTPARRQLWLQYERRASRIPHGETPLNPCRFDIAALAG